MICIIALVVFGILGIFSAAYRKLAAEAFDCVFRRITFRPCHSGLDKRLKSQIVGSIMKRSPRAANFTYKYFEVFSWAFIILTAATLAAMGVSFYNYVEYRNCNGPNAPENSFCIYKDIADAAGTFKADPKCANPSCQNINCTCTNATECLTKNIASCNATCIVGTTP
jgi:hypothetical protein